ncbi:serine/threonine-protein kinase [Chondromyces crocatus]|nr:serine/threonine-protein kinase [Chondromyces crocatus]
MRSEGVLARQVVASAFRTTVRRPVDADSDETWSQRPGAMVDGKYRLIKPQRHEGVTEVWLAAHERLRLDFVVKFIHEALLPTAERRQAALERFRFEAQVSARLGARTRHIVAVHDAGTHDGVPYYVMEHLPGSLLSDQIAQHGPLTPARLADLLDQTAQALEAAHAMSILHRDLKPQNLLISGDPEEPFVRVGGFGLAKALDADLGLDTPKKTQRGDVLGSLPYMSPEQIHGTETLDARTDLWSLAVIAYEALTGKIPFEGDSDTKLVTAIGTRPLVPPSRLRPDLPRALDTWFAQALAKKRDERFTSATELSRTFREAMNQPDPPVVEPSRREAVKAGMVGVVLGVACALSLTAALLWTFGEDDVDEARAAPSTTFVAPPPAATELAPEAAEAGTAAPAAERGSAAAPGRTPARSDATKAPASARAGHDTPPVDTTLPGATSSLGTLPSAAPLPLESSGNATTSAPPQEDTPRPRKPDPSAIQ